ncbi:MAG: DUF2281 domain-containing protein [Cytophagales bacterium]
MTKIQSIEKKLKSLPPSTMPLLDAFIDELLKKSKTGKSQPLTQDWAGALKEFKSQFTSLDLQKKALEWRAK